MKRKNKLIIAGLSTLLIISGAASLINIISNLNGSNTVITELIAQREVGYRQLITEANQTIENLNTQIANTQTESIRPTGENILLPDQALMIAQTNFGSDIQLASSPELVNYSGEVAYEIRFNQGNVYINANNGEIISSQLPFLITEQQAIASAAAYLGVLDTNNATVKKITYNSQEVFSVSISNYIVLIDETGNILFVQIIQYASLTNPSSSSSSSARYEEHDDDEDDDD